MNTICIGSIFGFHALCLMHGPGAQCAGEYFFYMYCKCCTSSLKQIRKDGKSGRDMNNSILQLRMISLREVSSTSDLQLFIFIYIFFLFFIGPFFFFIGVFTFRLFFSLVHVNEKEM